MGRVAELVRWTCDACGAEGDGVGRILPEKWKGLSRADGTDLLVFCPECIEVVMGLLKTRREVRQDVSIAVDELMKKSTSRTAHIRTEVLTLMMFGEKTDIVYYDYKQEVPLLG